MKLRQIRKATERSMYDVAQAAGIPYSNYWGMENGRRTNPNLATVARLAKVLECSIDELIAWDGALPGRPRKVARAPGGGRGRKGKAS